MKFQPATRVILILSLLVWSGAVGISQEKLRVLVETDAGGDPDDEQSLVRFLLYSNEWDVEGIIANRAQAREGENKNLERTGLGIVRRLVKAYGECHPNLIQHNPGFPKPDALLARVVPGYADGEDGVQLIIDAVDSSDPRPLWFMNWGTDDGSAPSCLKRALDQVLKKRGRQGYLHFKEKIRLSSADKFDEHTLGIEPPFRLWVDSWRPPIDGKRWYHQFSAIIATAGGFDLRRDVLTGHGPLGALYPTNTTHWQKEGDTMSFLYLIPTGMNDPEEPTWGSWAGRYGLRTDVSGKPYYWANQVDSWKGITNRANTLARWASHLQNDFRARLDWCVKPRNEANHRPVAVVNETTTPGILTINARPGTVVKLNAAGSHDPDGDSLSFQWLHYPEAGTYAGPARLAGENTAVSTLSIPEDASGKQIHVILMLEDNGTPPLVAYRRAIVRVTPSR